MPRSAKSITASFVIRLTDPEQLELRIGSLLKTLPHVLAGPGAKYSDGHTVVWLKGISAMLEQDNQSVASNCTVISLDRLFSRYSYLL